MGRHRRLADELAAHPAPRLVAVEVPRDGHVTAGAAAVLAAHTPAIRGILRKAVASAPPLSRVAFASHGPLRVAAVICRPTRADHIDLAAYQGAMSDLLTTPTARQTAPEPILVARPGNAREVIPTAAFVECVRAAAAATPHPARHPWRLTLTGATPIQPPPGARTAQGAAAAAEPAPRHLPPLGAPVPDGPCDVTIHDAMQAVSGISTERAWRIVQAVDGPTRKYLPGLKPGVPPGYSARVATGFVLAALRAADPASQDTTPINIIACHAPRCVLAKGMPPQQQLNRLVQWCKAPDHPPPAPPPNPVYLGRPLSTAGLGGSAWRRSLETAAPSRGSWPRDLRVTHRPPPRR